MACFKILELKNYCGEEMGQKEPGKFYNFIKIGDRYMKLYFTTLLTFARD